MNVPPEKHAVKTFGSKMLNLPTSPGVHEGHRASHSIQNSDDGGDTKVVEKVHAVLFVKHTGMDYMEEQAQSTQKSTYFTVCVCVCV